jgi:hypothetical protein
MKTLIFAVCAAAAAIGGASARADSGKPSPDGWQPSLGHVQAPLWPAAVPDAIPDPKPESVGPGGGANDVSRPTMTVYAAKGRNTGAAVVETWLATIGMVDPALAR